MDFAVIRAGGKQYLVHGGQKLQLDYAAGPPGQAVSFPMLLRVRVDGTVMVGTPMLAEPVAATVTSHGRSPKVTVIKFKRKVRYRRKVGHRSPTSVVEISALP